MKDFFESIRQQVGDRVTSPIFGSFFISWLLWNYRLLFVLFSDLSAEERFHYIDQTLYPNWPIILGRGLLLPAVMCGLYILLYNDLSRIILTHWHARENKLRAATLDAKKRQPLTIEETLQHWAEFDHREGTWKNRVTEQSRDVEALKSQLKAAVDSYGNQLSSIRSAHEDEKKILLREIETLKGPRNYFTGDPSVDERLAKVTPEVRSAISFILSYFSKDRAPKILSALVDYSDKGAIYEALRLNVIAVDGDYVSLTDTGVEVIDEYGKPPSRKRLSPPQQYT